jgi:hypothetical protein
VNLAQHLASPVVDLTPQKRRDIEQCDPLVFAPWAGKVDLDMSLSLIARNMLDHPMRYRSTQTTALRVSKPDTPFEQLCASHLDIGNPGNCQEVLACRSSTKDAPTVKLNRPRWITCIRGWMRSEIPPADLVQGELQLGSFSAPRASHHCFDDWSEELFAELEQRGIATRHRPLGCLAAGRFVTRGSKQGRSAHRCRFVETPFPGVEQILCRQDTHLKH